MSEKALIGNEQQPEYEVLKPEGKDGVQKLEKPDSFIGMEEEFVFHRDNLDFQYVFPIGQVAWTKDSLLDAITNGKVDCFTVEPPLYLLTPESGNNIRLGHSAYYFDDREFGERIANIVLAGFNRHPRP
ncbi:MAG TPA: hypothetical protein VMR51_00990 [Patescibacteria group bacterium]|jgi:hypothetical protein|nr:hypothetical protein [Patescibacteria group bacterium]